MGQSTPSTGDKLDESILQVAEMELKKIKSIEVKKPKVCTKLFPRHNSESYISPSRLLQSPRKQILQNVQNSSPFSSPKKSTNSTIDSRILSPKKLNYNIDPRILSPKKTNTLESKSNATIISNQMESIITSPILFPVVSKENLVTDTHSTISPVRTVRINVPLDLKIASYTVKKRTSPKFVKLNSTDLKKLVPVFTSPSTATSTVCSDDSDPNVTLYTQIPVKQISSGDTFRAIKIGNTVQLVPIEQTRDNTMEKKD